MKTLAEIQKSRRAPYAVESPAKRIGRILARYMKSHPDFYLFSPDETTSNKLDAVYESSARAWNLPRKDFDLPESGDGRIVEMLSENTLFACMVGHLIAGGPAMMTSYEAFFPIISAQILQHLKFLQQSSGVDWRPDYPAANLLSTSTCWRQDHNGFTHQSPALISTLLSLPSRRANCLFPIDSEAAEAATIFMLNSKNVVNLTTFNKTDQPTWLTPQQADAQFYQGGAIIFDPEHPKTFQDPAGLKQPDYVLVGIGDIVSCEALKALAILQQDFPDKTFRFINISALSYNAIGTTEKRLSQARFDEIFTKTAPIIANFHGYPAALRQILSCYTDPRRSFIHGYEEQGSTTTPFEMLSLNRASRYHLALNVARLEKRPDLVEKYQKTLADNRRHAHETGLDLPNL